MVLSHYPATQVDSDWYLESRISTRGYSSSYELGPALSAYHPNSCIVSVVLYNSYLGSTFVPTVGPKPMHPG
jgi:hypothetical protein